MPSFEPPLEGEASPALLSFTFPGYPVGPGSEPPQATVPSPRLLEPKTPFGDVRPAASLPSMGLIFCYNQERLRPFAWTPASPLRVPGSGIFLLFQVEEKEDHSRPDWPFSLSHSHPHPSGGLCSLTKKIWKLQFPAPGPSLVPEPAVITLWGCVGPGLGWKG